MRMLLLLLVLVLNSNISFADLSTEEPISCIQSQLSELSDNQVAQRGCCSHHGGVCGCSGGRAQCCDGALSPSCGCSKVDPIEIKNLEINQPQS